MQDFLNSHPGKGTIAVFLAALLIAWPPSLSWLVAAAALTFAAHHLREAFRALEVHAPVANAVLLPRVEHRATLPVGAEHQACDVNAILAAAAASDEPQ